MSVNNAVFDDSGTLIVNNMTKNSDNSYTLHVEITGLSIIWSDVFNNPHTLPVKATFDVECPDGENSNFIRESLFDFNSTYNVRVEGFYMNPDG